MVAKLRLWWWKCRSSFWFLPSWIVLGAVGLAAILIAVDVNIDSSFIDRWPLIFGAGAAGARGLLTAVASSMITVAGVVFSITIVALALTSSQYTSRVLQNFMRDRETQIVLGVFVGIFAYCLVVLRVIRDGDEGVFVPSLSVLGGLLLAFVGIGCLIVFIHHISVSIQASSIIASIARETIAAIDHLFPDDIGADEEEDASDSLGMSLADQAWSSVPAKKTGYIESIDRESLLIFARDHEAVVRMECGIGDFVVEGAPLLSVAGPGKLAESAVDDLNGIYTVGRHRTVEQDVGFGIRQIVDIALKALSPGINDTTTAVMCVDYLSAVLVRITPRRIALSHRVDQGELRVIARGPSFESLLDDAFNQIRQNATSNLAILLRMVEALETIANQTKIPRRRKALRHQLDSIASLVERMNAPPQDRAGVEAAVSRLSQRLH